MLSMFGRDRDPLRREAIHGIKTLGIKPYKSRKRVLQQIERMRQTKIQLVPFPFCRVIGGRYPRLLNGLWLGYREQLGRDMIFYESETSKIYQNQIIDHEIGELLADMVKQQTTFPTNDNFALLNESYPDIYTEVNRELNRLWYPEAWVIPWAVSYCQGRGLRSLDEEVKAETYANVLSELGWVGMLDTYLEVQDWE